MPERNQCRGIKAASGKFVLQAVQAVRGKILSFKLVRFFFSPGSASLHLGGVPQCSNHLLQLLECFWSTFNMKMLFTLKKKKKKTSPNLHMNM